MYNFQEVQDERTRPYTNGSVLKNSPVRIIASEYKPIIEDIEKEPSPEPKELTPEPKDPTPEPKEPTPEPKEPTVEPKESSPEPSPKPKEVSPETEQIIEPKERTPEFKETTPELTELTTDLSKELKEASDDVVLDEILKLTGNGDVKRPDFLIDSSKEFLTEESNAEVKIVSTSELEQGQQGEEKKQSTPELLAEALKEDSPQEEEVSEEEIEIEVEEEEEEEEIEPEKSTVKVSTYLYILLAYVINIII